MALTPASLSINPINLSVSRPTLTSGSEVVSYLVQFGIKNVQYLNVVTNTYIPNNDTLYVCSGIPSTQAPNVILVLASSQVNLTINAGPGNIMNYGPISKFMLITLAPNTTYAVNAMYIDGRSPGPLAPMPQSTPVDFTVIYCQATVT